MVNTAVQQRIIDGKGFLVSSDKMNLTGAGNFRLSMSNPSNSGKSIYVYRLAATSDAGACAYTTLIKNPTTGLPSGVKTPFNQSIGNTNTTVAVVNVDTSLVTPIGGGTNLTTLAVPGGGTGNRTVFDEFIIVIPPGGLMALNTVFAGAANAVVEVFYWEE